MKNQPLFILVTGLSILLILIILNSSLGSNITQTLGLGEVFVNYQDQDKDRVKIVEVVDGDTVKLDDGRTVRYLNIDTPETKKPRTPVQCFGPEASKTNKQLVLNKTVWLKADKEKTDRYGRELRFIFLNKEDMEDVSKSVNAVLVREGMARSSFYRPNITYKETFESLEAKAKKSKIGLWKTCPKPFEQ